MLKHLDGALFNEDSDCSAWPLTHLRGIAGAHSPEFSSKEGNRRQSLLLSDIFDLSRPAELPWRGGWVGTYANSSLFLRTVDGALTPEEERRYSQSISKSSTLSEVLSLSHPFSHSSFHAKHFPNTTLYL